MPTVVSASGVNVAKYSSVAGFVLRFWWSEMPVQCLDQCRAFFGPKMLPVSAERPVNVSEQCKYIPKNAR